MVAGQGKNGYELEDSGSSQRDATVAGKRREEWGWS